VEGLRYLKYAIGVIVDLTEPVEIPKGFGEVPGLEVHLAQQIEGGHMIRKEGERFFGVAGGGW
jgi:hypothetical protein